MDSAGRETGPTPPESELLVCLAAIARALHTEFQPRGFLDDFSTALQPLVPHDRLAIDHLADNRRTFSVFAEHGAPGVLPTTDRYTTDLQRAARFPIADSPLAAVFDGDVLCVSDLAVDPRFVRCVRYRDELLAGGVRSAIFVPLLVGNRVIGDLRAASRVMDAFGAVHVQRMRSVGRLIGPFIETIALLYEGRRLRHRVGRLTGITQLIGTTLNVREILSKLGDAIRLAVEFDTLGVILLKSGAPDYAFFGRSANRRCPVSRASLPASSPTPGR